MSFTSFAVDLLLPPPSLAWIGLLALAVPRRLRRVPGRLIAVLVLVPLVLLSMPLVSQTLLYSLEPTSVPPPGAEAPGAIVVLSADSAHSLGPAALEVGPLTLERERGGAALYRRTGLPVLVTGGVLTPGPALGTMMATSMTEDFGVPVRWVEARSLTTWENAQFSAPILKAAGISRVYLVTHAWHMPRSVLAFERAGLQVVAAPLRLDAPGPFVWGDLVPRVSAWQRSYFAIHEWVGLLAYAWRR